MQFYLLVKFISLIFVFGFCFVKYMYIKYVFLINSFPHLYFYLIKKSIEVLLLDILRLNAEFAPKRYFVSRGMIDVLYFEAGNQ